MEIIAEATPEYEEVTKAAVEHYMKIAAKLAGFDIGATAKSGKTWFDAH